MNSSDCIQEFKWLELWCRCQVRDKEEEEKDMKEKLAELEELLKQSEAHRQDLEQSHRLKDQQLTAALSAAKVFSS